MLPHLVGRPLTLVASMTGIADAPAFGRALHHRARHPAMKHLSRRRPARGRGRRRGRPERAHRGLENAQNAFPTAPTRVTLSTKAVRSLVKHKRTDHLLTTVAVAIGLRIPGPDDTLTYARWRRRGRSVARAGLGRTVPTVRSCAHNVQCHRMTRLSRWRVTSPRSDEEERAWQQIA
jgi:hypothetical protein